MDYRNIASVGSAVKRPGSYVSAGPQKRSVGP